MPISARLRPKLKAAIAPCAEGHGGFHRLAGAGGAAARRGPSGIGKDNYTWYQQNVHFVPFTWDEEVVLLRRELERAQAALKLEEHNNRKLPQLEPAADAAGLRSTEACAAGSSSSIFWSSRRSFPTNPTSRPR